MQLRTTLLWRLGEIFLFYLLLFWLGVMLLAGNILCIPLFFTSKKFREPLVQQLISGTFRLFLFGSCRIGLMQMDLAALDQLNGRRKLILAANHPSMIDVFLVLSRVHHATCLMKASIGTNLFLGIGAYLAGYVSNQQTDLMLRSAVSSVKRGNLLLAFPEGTRTTSQPFNRFKSGFALISKRASAPIQTIFLVTNSPYLSKGWKIWRPPSFPLIYKASLGMQLLPGSTTTETASLVQAYFEKYLDRSVDPTLHI